MGNFCRLCGEPISQISEFCPRCGAKYARPQSNDNKINYGAGNPRPNSDLYSAVDDIKAAGLSYKEESARINAEFDRMKAERRAAARFDRLIAEADAKADKKLKKAVKKARKAGVNIDDKIAGEPAAQKEGNSFGNVVLGAILILFILAKCSQ
ncbi:MAG: zinc ribbon domain-containing protein [Lachnospiraceae bacterium]|nr:zinc ribbon domain-containing protein [Lachnospiraceae bacterium]